MDPPAPAVLAVLVFLYICCSTVHLSNCLDIRVQNEPAFIPFSISPSPSVSEPLTVPLTLIQGADSKGAVCLDGTLPAYHFDPGFGSGANSWLIQLDGGGWCDSADSCAFRKTTRRGSSNHMERNLSFTGILSNRAEDNPDFFNWNRVKLRYCDGASFAGDGQDEVAQLYFRGQRIWSVAMEYFMEMGMQNADKTLLSGCSAGGLASILHCDEFRALFPESTKVKCLGDAGMFLDAIDVSGGRTLRDMFSAVVNLQGVQSNLPHTCTDHMDPTLCFFPQNLIADVKTPLFLLNAAYDAWQVKNSLVSKSADPQGSWKPCEEYFDKCNSSQVLYLQDFRNQMLGAVEVFSRNSLNGLFINSCFSHCHSEEQDTWFADNSPRIGNKRVAEAVGDWYFEREQVKAIDSPYPCDKTCHNLITGNVTSKVPDFCSNVPSKVSVFSWSTRISVSLLDVLTPVLMFIVVHIAKS